MSRFILIVIFVMIHSTVFSQRHISGRVVDTNGEPIRWAEISTIVNRSNSINLASFSNKNGEFRFLKPIRPSRIIISKKGYQIVRIENIDTIFHPLTIVMVEAPNRFIYGNQYNSFTLSFKADYLSPSFNSFKPILGKENVDNLNFGGSGGFEYALAYNGFYFALNHGHGLGEGVQIDSVNAINGRYKKFLLGTHFGYNIIHSKRFIITPMVGVNWHRDRMMNYDSKHRIPIEQYITNRDLDIRFNHLFGFAGINCRYKLSYIDEVASWGIGFYGGYAFKLNDKPWVYSGNNRLITDQKVDFNNFNWGITLFLYFNL